MTDLLYQKLLKHWEEVTELPTQQVGPLTPVYKAFSRRLKVMPWPLLVLMSITVVVAIYLLLGSTVTLLVNLLQRGF